MDSLADTVILGPKGRNVILKKKMVHRTLPDGVTVAKEIEFEDAYQNMRPLVKRWLPKLTMTPVTVRRPLRSWHNPSLVLLKNVTAGANPGPQARNRWAVAGRKPEKQAVEVGDDLKRSRM